MRVVVERYDSDVVVRLLDDSWYCSRSHVVKTIMRIPDQTMGISHFICNVPDNVTAGAMRMIVEAFAAGLESSHVERGSDCDRVRRASGTLDINLAPFFGCN